MGKRWSHFFFNFISIPIIHQYSLLFFLSLIKLLSNKVAAGNTQLLLSTTGVISGKLEGKKIINFKYTKTSLCFLPLQSHSLSCRGSTRVSKTVFSWPAIVHWILKKKHRLYDWLNTSQSSSVLWCCTLLHFNVLTIKKTLPSFLLSI